MPDMKAVKVVLDHAPQRVVIEGVRPEIDGGRYPAKATVGEKFRVEANIFADGHDVLSAVLLYRRAGEPLWSEIVMTPLVNDRWRAEFTPAQLGCYQYTIKAWVDDFATWRRDTAKKVEAGLDVSVELLAGVKLVEEASHRTGGSDADYIESLAKYLAGNFEAKDKLRVALGDELNRLMAKHPDMRSATTYPKQLSVNVDRKRAEYSAWYEMFPRSTSTSGRHGTFKDCEARLPYIAAMGFDVLYLPPVHPIGQTKRKGRNNATSATSSDPGSPWAIGSGEGGHKSIDPRLGTLEDFRHLVAKAKEHSIEVALDIALQCSPDHPYVKQHPEWFRWRPNGTVQFAENPPKKYEDIYPLNFETDDWQSLWDELKSIFMFWIEQGVSIFRVDNPHTKPFAFWEWLIREVKQVYPDTIFLAEAFTRPRIMYQLAKLGFTQSYTYFAWRNAKWELTEYFTELTKTDVADYFRPNLWPNTPDILTEYLQTGGRPAFMAKLVLAATLGASYGIYGPAFELQESQPREPRSEEYLNSEKYELRNWDIDRRDSLSHFIARVNRIRRENSALHNNRSLQFHPVDNENLICYSKNTDDFSDIVLVAVNVNPGYTQSGWVDLNLREFGLDSEQPYQLHDLLTDARYTWQGARNYVELDPHVSPAHIFRLQSIATNDVRTP